MRGLLDAATVVEGDGHWESGYEFDSLACGRTTKSFDICAPAAVTEPSDSMSGYRVYPWAIYTYQKFSPRCSPGEAESEAEQALARGTGREVAKNFWAGDVAAWPGSVAAVGNGLYLTHTDIATVATGANVQATLAAVLQKAFDNHSDIVPVVHLGLLSALNLAANKLDEDQSIKWVVSPSYPVAAVAVTGPIMVHLGSIETTKNPDALRNRTYIEATRIVAVEFDPCLAVRAV